MEFSILFPHSAMRDSILWERTENTFPLPVIQEDWTVNLVIMLLIIIGGIGFFIWTDLSENKLHFRRWKLHTKITILMTLALVFGGAAVLFALEYNNTLAGRPLDEQILCSLFRFRYGENGRV